MPRGPAPENSMNGTPRRGLFELNVFLGGLQKGANRGRVPGHEEMLSKWHPATQRSISILVYSVICLHDATNEVANHNSDSNNNMHHSMDLVCDSLNSLTMVFLPSILTRVTR